MKTVVTVDRQLVKAIAIWSEQLAHQYCNIASQYCNLARNRTPDVTVICSNSFRYSAYRTEVENLNETFFDITDLATSLNNLHSL